MRIGAAGLILMALTLFAYWPVVNHDFINYDDPLYLTDNIQIRQGLTPEGLVWAFTTSTAANWHPVTWLSHMLDVDLFGMNPAWHHLMNVLFHILTAVLIFLIFNQMTGEPWPSVVLAALFALHPLNVESVAWAAERKNVLSTLLGLLVIWRYTLYVRQTSRRAFIPVLVYYALGLMAKPMLVTLPMVLLLLDYWPLRRFDLGLRHLIIEKIPFFVLAAISSGITVFVQQSGQAVMPMTSLPVSIRLTHSLIAYVAYLRKMIWPIDLAVFYPHPLMSPVWKIIACGLFLCAVSIVAWRLRQRSPYFIVGWLWYLGTLVPVIGIVQVGRQGMADRYAYLPLIGIFILLSWGIRQWAESYRNLRPVIWAPIVFMVVMNIGLSRNQVGYWANSVTLYEHALSVTQENALAHNNLGMALTDRGYIHRAISHYREAIRLRPDDDQAVNNLASAVMKAGKTDAAIALYQQALRIHPKSAMAHNNLAAALEEKGRVNEARMHYNMAIRMDPENAKAHYNFGSLLARKGQSQTAIEHFKKAVAINPFFADAHNNLGIELEKHGAIDAAIGHYQRALRLNPEFAQAYNNLGIALVRIGRPAQAAEHFEKALQINPEFTEAKNNLMKLRELMKNAN